jgi:hypothetical protein
MASMTTISEQPPPFESLPQSRFLDGSHEVERARSVPSLAEATSELQSQSQRTPLRTLTEYEAEEDELPQYDDVIAPAALPQYEERHLLEPVVSYNMYQIDRKLQIVTPATRAGLRRPRYRIGARSGIFSKKPDFTLTRLLTGAAAGAESSPGKEVAWINFDRSSQLPWMPRAKVELASGGTDNNVGHVKTHDMSAPNFSDWKVNFNNELYYWRLMDKPTSLSLMEVSSESIIARFKYSKHGTDAIRGAEVGTMEIYGGSRNEDLETVEFVLSTCQVPLIHWRNMGRHYRNDVTPRNCSASGPIVLGNSFFSGMGGGDGSRRVSNLET